MTPVCQRFHREKQNVGDQKQLKRSEIRQSLSRQICFCKDAGTDDDKQQTADKPAVQIGKSLDGLFEDTPHREFARPKCAFTAGRAVCCQDGMFACRAGPGSAPGCGRLFDIGGRHSCRLSIQIEIARLNGTGRQ